MRGLLHRLHRDAAAKVYESFAPRSKGPLNSALQAFARFAAACPERTLFQQSTHRGDRSSTSWNEWTFILFAQYLGERPSTKTKKPISVKSIESYISLVKGYFAHTYDFEVPEGAPRLSKLIKALRADQPVPGGRAAAQAARLEKAPPEGDVEAVGGGARHISKCGE